jgi:hypothetical protein
LSPATLGFKFESVPPKPAQLPTPRTSILSPGYYYGETVHLPPFFVHPRQDIPEEKEMLTDFGRLQFARKKFISPLYRATFGPLAQIGAYYLNFLSILNGWHPNDAEAMALYRESERLQILTNFDDLRRIEELGEPGTSDEFKQMRARIRRTGIDALYWDPSAGASGIHIGAVKR